MVAMAMKRERRQSGGSTSGRQRMRRHSTKQRSTTQHVTFSATHSSDEDEVPRKVATLTSSPVPAKDGLPQFLNKNLSQTTLAPPTLSITNAISKDLHAKLDHHFPAEPLRTGTSPETPSSSTGTAPFHLSLATSQPQSLTSSSSAETDRGPLPHNHSSTSLAQHEALLPSTHTKLTRTQQKLLLQRASTQPLPQPLTSPSRLTPHQSDPQQDYFSPRQPATQSLPSVGMTYDVKVAREFERVARELSTVQRFSDPLNEALRRLDRCRVSGFRAGQVARVTGKRPGRPKPRQREGSREVVMGRGVFSGEDESQVRECLRRLWVGGTGSESESGGGVGSSESMTSAEERMRRVQGNGRARTRSE
jgi:TORC1 subunit TCO89